MAKSDRNTKKRNFTDCEVEVLVNEVEQRQRVLFGGHSSGITNAKKTCEWEHVAHAVNAAASQGRTIAEIKKKWSDIKVDAKKRIAAHRQSVRATGGGKGQPELTQLDEKLAGIIGETLLSGIVREEEGDTDVGPHETAEDSVAGCSSEANVAAAAAEVPSPSTASDPPAATPRPATSARVLTDAVLQVQREHVEAIREVARELREIKNELSELNANIKEFVQKYANDSCPYLIIHKRRITSSRWRRAPALGWNAWGWGSGSRASPPRGIQATPPALQETDGALHNRARLAVTQVVMGLLRRLGVHEWREKPLFQRITTVTYTTKLNE
ncbi:t-SNARE domain-containing protein 1-like [Sardina pilchardus]|uniref:t-SNARE domain-containing protein 1-like n=1 Tax=Sardina pilchardus TaxID=27697 RepID=UPI002E128EBB